MNIKINKIVAELVETGKLDQLIYSFYMNDNYEVNTYLKEEFRQELCIILLEYKDPQKLIRLYDEGRLDYFILGIIKRQLKSVNSPFWKTHNRWEYNREVFNELGDYDC